MAGATKHGFRADIQALRACAVSAVVLFHMGVPVIDGGFVGVDIFFVISGFLITRQLVAEHDLSGRISFTAFYARRIRRLLPLATLVLVSTLVAAALLISPFDLSSIAADAGWTAGYLANFRFAFSGESYFAITPSPLVHYWSLAVEEQFYVVWPALLALLLVKRRWLRVGVVVLLVASFAHSLIASTQHPDFAYYSSTTRAWQLLAGALVAISFPAGLGSRRPAGARVNRVAWWARESRARSVALTGGVLAGFLVLLASVLLINETYSYPGVVAVFPVVGTMLILTCAPGSAAWLTRVMAFYPVALLGELSYGWYLWHWPFIIFAEREFDNGSTARLIAGGLALVLAWVTFHLVENPLRRGVLLRLPARALITAAVAITLVIGSSVAVHAYNQNRLSQPQYVALKKALEAPSPAGPDCFSPDVANLLKNCSGGDPDGPRLVLAGDSNARMWYPAFLELGKQLGFQTVLYSGNGCNVLGFPSEVLIHDCNTYSQGLDATFAALHPDAVVFTHLRTDKMTRQGTAWLTRLRTFVQARQQQGATVGSIDNVPAAPFDVEGCLLDHLSDYAACNLPEKKSERGAQAWTAFQAPVLDQLGVTQLDPASLMCHDNVCPIQSPGGVITFRDSGHITGQFAAELAPDLALFVRTLLPDLPPAATAG